VVDDLLRQSRATFDQADYVKTINRALSLILDDAPAHFLWQHNILYDVSNDIKFTAQPDHRVFGYSVQMNSK
jgi:peptide/nickel transport system substrate-binding protein